MLALALAVIFVGLTASAAPSLGRAVSPTTTDPVPAGVTVPPLTTPPLTTPTPSTAPIVPVTPRGPVTVPTTGAPPPPSGRAGVDATPEAPPTIAASAKPAAHGAAPSAIASPAPTVGAAVEDELAPAIEQTLDTVAPPIPGHSELDPALSLGTIGPRLPGYAFPSGLALLIVVFLVIQHRLDRHDPKLTDAPIDRVDALIPFSNDP